MVEVNGLKFATSIGVLFALKEARGHTTLQETYASVGRTDFDNIYDVLRVCREKSEGRSITPEAFAEELGEREIGFGKLTSVFTLVIEKLMFSGMTPQEVEEAKKQMLAAATKK